MDRLGAFVAMILIVGYLISSLSDNMMAYLAYGWYFWFTIGAACAVVVAHQRSTQRVSELGSAARADHRLSM